LGGHFSMGTSVNASGQVTGISYTTGDSATHAFLFSGGAMTDLGTLPGSFGSAGAGINAAGQVVGSSGTGSGRHAFLSFNGVMTDLNTLVAPDLGYTLKAANGISDSGFITGYALNRSGQARAFLLTPAPNLVPESSTAISLGLLLTLALGGLVVSRRKSVLTPNGNDKA